MNLNHDPDKHLLDQIDKRLTSPQPVGDTVIDELAATQPRPREAFQQALEARLLARVETLSEGETLMTTNTAYLPVESRRRSLLPLTLLAAMLVVVVAGGLLLSGGRSPTSEISLAQPSASATATRVVVTVVPPAPAQNLRIPGVGGVSPVVIAIRDIPQGTVLSSQWLATTYWGALDTRSMYTDPELLRGMVAKRDIPRWQPIVSGDLSDAPVPTGQPTAVPMQTVKVLVAFQNLPIGYRFDDRSVANVVGYVDWPADSVPIGALSTNEPVGGMAAVAGKILLTSVVREQPILATMLGVDTPSSNLSAIDRTAIEVPVALLTVDSLTPDVGSLVDIVALLPFTGNQPNIDGVPATALPDGTRLIEKFVVFGAAALTAGEQTESVVFSVPPDEGRLLAWLVEQGITLRLQAPMSSGIQHLGNRRVIDIPIENLTAAESIQVGDTVDVYSTCSFVAVLGVVQTLDCDQSLEEKQTDGVVIFGEWAADGQPQGNTESIGLAVLPDVYTHLAGLTAAGMQFKLVKSLDTQSVVPTFTPTPMLVPPGKVAIAVPMASLTEAEGEGLNVGDNVDVIVTYKMVEVGDAPGEFQQMMTPEPGEIAQLTQRMMKGATIVGMSDTPVQAIILAVTPQEAVIFEWVLEAKLPITLRPYPASADPNADSSPYTLQLPLDSLSRWAADDIQVGDSVDLVMGFVLGNTDTISLDFKRYGTHTWGDPLSDGSISAQIYAPLNEQAGGASAFMLRVLQGAVITAMQVNTDPVSGRMSDATVTLEMPAGTRASSVEALKGYVEAGIPYLLVTR